MNTNIDKASTKTSFLKQKNAPETHDINKAFTKHGDLVKNENANSKTKKGTNVTISDAIRDFSRIKKAVDDAPELDNSSKIAELKNKIKEGKYNIDYDTLAENILTKEF